MPNFSHRRQKHIIVCMVLHNFIHNIPVRGEDFNKYNEDEDYMPQDENDNKVQEVTQQSEYNISDEENEVFINIIHNNIANILISGESLYR
jgi:hypothetical protein